MFGNRAAAISCCREAPTNALVTIDCTRGVQRRHRRSAMPHRGRYTERPAPATDAARQSRTRCGLGSAPRRSSQASSAGRLLCDPLVSAPVFRTALFADLMALVVLDFLRLAFFMNPLVPKFVQLGCSLVHAKPRRLFSVPAQKKDPLPSLDECRAGVRERDRGALAAERADQPLHPSSGCKDKLMRVTTASQERFSCWGYTRSKQ